MRTTLKTKILLGFTQWGGIAESQANFWVRLCVTLSKSLKFSGPESFSLDIEAIFKSYNLIIFPGIYCRACGVGEGLTQENEYEHLFDRSAELSYPHLSR